MSSNDQPDGAGDGSSFQQSGNLSFQGFLGAFLLYTFLSILFFARGLAGQFTTAHFGKGADAPLMMWCLVWWPHAIAHGLNPFLTGAYWAPHGFNITWSTSIPLASLLAAPITHAIGPVASMNILCLASFPLAACCAFMLCHLLSRNYWASILGGFIFGFSPFLLAQLSFGRLHTLWIFPVPLAVYCVVRRLEGSLTTRAFVASLAIVLVVEFLCAAEIFATMTIFGLMILVLHWLDSSKPRRARINRVIVELAGSYLIALLIISPYLYYMLLSPRPYRGAMWPDVLLSADLLNFLVPAPNNELGAIPWLDRLSAPFNAGISAEEVAYLSLPVLLIAAHYIWLHWREPFAKLLTFALLIMLVLSLGPHLVVEGQPTRVSLPWSILRVSVLENAAPGRFCAYLYLIFAIVGSLWLSSVGLTNGLKIVAGTLVVISLLPNLSADYWIVQTNEPKFFRDGLYKNYLTPNETVLILPFWTRNDSMLWQAQSHMYFRMAGGPGPWPAEFAIWPIVEAFSLQTYVPDAAIQLRTYLTDHNVSTLIVTDESLATWAPFLATTLDAPIVKVGGVSLYRTSLMSKAPIKPLSDLRADFDNARFETLLTNVDRYLSNGGSLSDLTASHAVSLGLIPTADLVGPAEPPPEVRHPEVNKFRQPDYSYGVVLFVVDKQIVIGISASYPDAIKLIEKYGRYSSQTAFSPPDFASIARKDSDAVGIVAMSFERDKLSQAASLARAH